MFFQNKKPLITVEKHVLASEALDLMNKNQIHHLVVLDKGNFFGVVTSRGLNQLLSGMNWLGNTRSPLVGEVTHFELPTVDESSDLKTIVRHMIENGSTAVVVKKNKEVVGIITETDLLRVLDNLLDRANHTSDFVAKAESLLANPIAQRIMSAIGNAGI